MTKKTAAEAIMGFIPQTIALAYRQVININEVSSRNQNGNKCGVFVKLASLADRNGIKGNSTPTRPFSV